MSDEAAGFDGERFARWLAPLGTVAVVAGIALFNPAGMLLIAIGSLLLALACWSRRDGLLLFGPFPRTEMLATIRRQRMHLWWTLAVAAAAAVILIGYGFAYFRQHRPDQIAFVASIVFLFIAWNAFLIVFSLVITIVSYAIAEERDSRRIDFLLASDLRSREIVAGKLAGRLIASLVYPLALLPLVMLLPLLFGIDPRLIAALGAFAFIIILSLSGLAILSSVLAATKKAGGFVLTALVLPYLLLSFGLDALRSYPEVWHFPGTPALPARVAFSDVAEAFNSGNAILAARGWITNDGLDLSAFTRDFRGFAAFHIGAFLVSILAAAALLRTQSTRMADRPKQDVTDKTTIPSVGDRPVMWKEQHFAHLLVKARRSTTYRMVALVMIGVPLALFLAAAVFDVFGYAEKIREIARVYPALMIWIFAISGSRFGLESVVREREKGTLTSLLLTDIPPRGIIKEKLLGILRAFLSSWLALVLLLAASVACGGMSAWGAALGAVMAAVLLVFFVILGLHTSVKANSLEAASKIFGWKLAPFAVAAPLMIVCLLGLPTMPPDIQWIAAASLLGMTALHGLLAWLFWRWTVKRFQRACDPAIEQPQAEVNPVTLTKS